MTRLTHQRKVFIEEYLKCWNATEAARRAGYSHPRVMGSRLTKVDIVREEIAKRLREKAIDADEVLARLGEQARASMADFCKITESGDPKIDLAKAEEEGKLHLIKSMYYTRHGLRIELYDAQAALSLIGKHHRLFVERTEIEGGEKPVVVQVIGGVDLDDV